MAKIDYNLVDFNSSFSYSEDSPTGLVWNKTVYCCNPPHILKNIGDIAGGIDKHDNYSRVYLNGKSYLAHRIIWILHNSRISDDCEIDHIDGNRTNNLINNLREIPRVINSRNHKMKKNNSTGVTGVSIKDNGCGNLYFVARWRDSTLEKEFCKHFSIELLGKEDAFKLACEYRSKMIAKQNEIGAGYTERHGVAIEINNQLANIAPNIFDNIAKGD